MLWTQPQWSIDDVVRLIWKVVSPVQCHSHHHHCHNYLNHHPNAHHHCWYQLGINIIVNMRKPVVVTLESLVHYNPHHEISHSDKNQTCGGDARMPSYGDRPICRVSSELASLSCHRKHSHSQFNCNCHFANFECGKARQVTNCAIPKVS